MVSRERLQTLREEDIEQEKRLRKQQRQRRTKQKEKKKREKSGFEKKISKRITEEKQQLKNLQKSLKKVKREQNQLSGDRRFKVGRNVSGGRSLFIKQTAENTPDLQEKFSSKRQKFRQLEQKRKRIKSRLDRTQENLSESKTQRARVRTEQAGGSFAEPGVSTRGEPPEKERIQTEEGGAIRVGTPGETGTKTFEQTPSGKRAAERAKQGETIGQRLREKGLSPRQISEELSDKGLRERQRDLEKQRARKQARQKFKKLERQRGIETAGELFRAQRRSRRADTPREGLFREAQTGRPATPELPLIRQAARQDVTQTQRTTGRVRKAQDRDIPTSDFTPTRKFGREQLASQPRTDRTTIRRNDFKLDVPRSSLRDFGKTREKTAGQAPAIQVGKRAFETVAIGAKDIVVRTGKGFRQTEKFLSAKKEQALESAFGEEVIGIETTTDNEFVKTAPTGSELVSSPEFQTFATVAGGAALGAAGKAGQVALTGVTGADFGFRSLQVAKKPTGKNIGEAALSGGFFFGTVKGSNVIKSPFKKGRARIPTKRGTIKAETFGVEVGTRSVPIASRVKTPRGTKLSLGKPRRNVVTPAEVSKPVDLPVSSLGTKALKTTVDVPPRQAKGLEARIGVARKLRKQPGRPVEEFTADVPGVRKPKKTGRIVEEELGTEGVIFGSVTEKQLPRGTRKKQPGDIDVFFPEKTPQQTEARVSRIARRLQAEGENVRVSPRNARTIEFPDTGQKFLEAKPGKGQISSEEIAPEGFAGIRFADIKSGETPSTVSFGETRAIKAGEQLARKTSASAILTPAKETNPPGFERGGFFGKPRRLQKDIAGFVRSGKGLVEVTRKSKNPFKRVKGRRAQKDLDTFLDSLTQRQRKTVNQQLEESGAVFKLETTAQRQARQPSATPSPSSIGSGQPSKTLDFPGNVGESRVVVRQRKTSKTPSRKPRSRSPRLSKSPLSTSPAIESAFKSPKPSKKPSKSPSSRQPSQFKSLSPKLGSPSFQPPSRKPSQIPKSRSPKLSQITSRSPQFKQPNLPRSLSPPSRTPTPSPRPKRRQKPTKLDFDLNLDQQPQKPKVKRRLFKFSPDLRAITKAEVQRKQRTKGRFTGFKPRRLPEKPKSKQVDEIFKDVVFGN